MRTILHEASRRLADIKKLDAMRIFFKTLDTKVYNGNHEVPVRLYFPSEEAMSGDVVEGEKYPVLLFFHGGGWVTESIENYDRVCSRMAQSTGHIVMSVEYRLAPEYRFPIPFEDCYEAAKALYTGRLILPADPDRITIIGDSAGGNLAAAVCLKARNTGDFTPKKQILIYPAVNNCYTAKSPYRSVQENGEDYLLTAAKMEDYPSVLKYAPYAKEDKEVGKYAMEFISTALKAQGDTVKWIASLKDGIQKYPEHSFFFGHLIDYYSNNNKFDEAMQFADDMLAKDPNNTFYLYVKGYLYHNMKDYEKAIEFYNKTIEVDPNYAEAYSNLGLIYCLQAQDFSEKATTDVNNPKYKEDQATLKVFYEKARPNYEKARELKPEQKDLWLNGLYRVYYNLQMGPEFDEIEKLMQ